MDQLARIRQLRDMAERSPVAAERMAAFREAERLAQSCYPGNDYQRGAVHPPSDCDFLQPLLSPDAYLTVPGLVSIDANSDGTVERLDLKGLGEGAWVIGWNALAIDFTEGAMAAGDLEQATMSVAVSFNGQENLVTDGEAPSFAPLATLFRHGVQWSPICRRVRPTDFMTFQFQNNQPATGHALTPRCTVAIRNIRYPGT